MESIIKGTLAHLSEETLTCLLEHLSNIGIRTSDDFRFLTEDDLKQMISLIDSRKLLHAFNNRGKTFCKCIL